MWLKICHRLFKLRQLSLAGLTLTELLVAVSVSSVVISTLLFIMTDLMQNNQREQSLSAVQQDMQQVLDYMSQELREAIYIYNGDELVERPNDIPGLSEFLPDFGDKSQVILAFWKVEPLPYLQSDGFPNCNTAFANNEDKTNECTNVRIERRAYTLVVYLQSWDNQEDWRGKSRISRYTLRKYSKLSNLTRSVGYVDPMTESTFKRWPLGVGGVSLQGETPIADTLTLVDYVASPTTPLKTDTSCPSDYIRSPYDDPTLKTDDNNSFFACVRDTYTDSQASFNQDTWLFLRGNAHGKAGIHKDSPLNLLQKGVISRSVIDVTVPE